jgi:acyl carrier protein
MGSESTATTTSVAAVRELVIEMSPFKVTDVSPDAMLTEELGFDSLGLVELLVVIEDRLDLSPLEEQAPTGIAQVADLERLVVDAPQKASSR